MARKKVNLAYIVDDVVRRATFKRRCRGLLKKVNELSILCDVDACIVIYAPGEAQPEVWPNELEARRLLENFRSLPELEQSKRMMTQASFLEQRVTKMTENYNRVYRGVHELEMTVLMYEGLAGYGLPHGITKNVELLCFVETKLKDVRRKIDAVKAKEEEIARATEVERVKMDTTVIEQLRRQNWFTEMATVGAEQTMHGQFGGLNYNMNNDDNMGEVFLDNGYGSSWMMPDFPFFSNN